MSASSEPSAPLLTRLTSQFSAEQQDVAAQLAALRAQLAFLQEEQRAAARRAEARRREEGLLSSEQG